MKVRKIFLGISLLASVFSFSAVASPNISQIQGIYHRSPYENKEVKSVVGAVTQVYKTKYYNGFYMQRLVSDKDERTSEGIYVENKSGLDVKAGDYVSVDGLVKEMQFKDKIAENELTITSIQANNVKVLRENVKVTPKKIEGSKIPKNIHDGKITDKLDVKKNAMDYYESLEGMLVVVKDPVITGNAESNGEISVLPDGGKYATNRTNTGGVRYTYQNEQTQRILVGDEFISLRNGKVFKDPNFTPNPGDKFAGDIEGIMSFSYANYKLFNTKPLPEIIDSGAKRDTPKYEYDKDYLNVAMYNIENFASSENPERVAILAKQIKDDLKTPDIIGLVEVGDDNGGNNKDTTVVSAKENIKNIIKAIKDVSGVEYGYMTVDPEHGKDGGWLEMHIRNVILYRIDRLKPAYIKQGDAKTDTSLIIENGKLKLTLNPGRIGNNEKFFEEVRKPVIGHLMFEDKDVFVMVNHLKSKRSDEKLYSAVRPAVRPSEEVRNPEAIYINNFLNQINANNKDAVILVMGDMNDFEFSNTLKFLKGDLLVSAVENLPAEQRHTYVYQGNSQVLDNLLVNKKYAENMRSDILNINSEMTRAQGYFSDHDPIFMQIKVK